MTKTQSKKVAPFNCSPWVPPRRCLVLQLNPLGVHPGGGSGGPDACFWNVELSTKATGPERGGYSPHLKEGFLYWRFKLSGG